MARKDLNVVPDPLDDFAADGAKIRAYAARADIPDVRKPAQSESVVTPASPARKVKKTFDLPEYVLDALNMKATQETSSAAYLILKALKDSGTVEVMDADLIPDKRRLPGSGTA